MDQMIGNFRWAILLCQFSDTTPSVSKQHFEDLFSNQGTGGLRDYWRDVSHGFMNIDGTDVYGWRAIGTPLADFKKLAREQRVQVAAEAFSQGDDAVDFSNYFGIMVIHDQTGLDGGSPLGLQEYTLNGVKKRYAAVVGNMIENQRFLAHEMGHGFGLDHSFDDTQRLAGGNPGEYWDQWDIMSAQNVWSFTPPSNPTFGRSGPILNASNMHDIGWLDSRRVKRFGGGITRITLLPLNRPDLNGFVAAFVDPYWIEFRFPAGWDAGIGNAVVLVHTGEDRINGVGQKVRMSALHASKVGGNLWGLGKGDTFERGTPNSKFKKYLKIEVLDIDLNPANPSVTLDITYYEPARIPQEGTLAWILEGFLAITPEGKIERVPPHSPLRDILVGAVVYQLAEELEEADQKADLQRYSMNLIQQVAQKAARLPS